MKKLFLIPLFVWLGIFDFFSIKAAYKYISSPKSKDLANIRTGANSNIPSTPATPPERFPDNEVFFDGKFDDQITVDEAVDKINAELAKF